MNFIYLNIFITYINKPVAPRQVCMSMLHSSVLQQHLQTEVSP